MINYIGCLVQGPLTCTLLLDLIRDNLSNDNSFIKSFSYRALSPLYVGEEFKICGKKRSDKKKNKASNTPVISTDVYTSSDSSSSDLSYEAWAENKEGGLAMKGTAIVCNV